MADIYVHPTITSNPLGVTRLQQATGLHAVAQGHRVRLVAPPAARGGIEQRGNRLFVVHGGAGARGEDPPGRPQ
ncbi:MAG TPA: hypothetical protein DCZ11_05305 [Gammaproteobacteria bacterium]|nr:hypothetical protein [Gammaproteobacteria bacterium]MCH77839.1 hypothetical protein [Gammaproteobacteria bacterium]